MFNFQDLTLITLPDAFNFSTHNIIAWSTKFTKCHGMSGTNIPWGAFSVDALPACRAQKRLPRAILGHTKTFEEKAQKPPLDNVSNTNFVAECTNFCVGPTI